MRFLHGTHAGDTVEWMVGLLLVAGVVGLLLLACPSCGPDGRLGALPAP